MQTYFEFKKNNTSYQTEVFAGIASFLATSYVIIVNPSILSEAGLPFSGVLTATVLVSFFSSVLMGIYARNPVLIAPGMGLNAFFTYSAVIGMNIPWQVALGAVFWSGIVFLLLSVFNIRTYIIKAIPKPLRYAIAGGIGLFITLLGLSNAKFIIQSPGTILAVNELSPTVLTFIVGLLLTAILLVKNVKGGILIGIIVTTLLAYPLGRWWGTETIVNWQGIFAAPDFSLLMQLDLVNSLQFAIWPVIFAFLFTDLFDSLSTFVGLAEAANMVDEHGEPLNIKKSLFVDAVATTMSGLVGTSSATVYVESAVGIEAGGRTGLTAIVGGLLFLPFLFLAPLLSMVPAIATAPALVLVGAFMIRPIIRINWLHLSDAIPAFLALVLIPFTFSITQGIIWGFLSYTLLKVVGGEYKKIPLTLWIIDVFCILALLVH